MWNNAPLLPAGQNANPVPPRRYQVANPSNPSLYDIREVMKTGDFKFAIPLLTRYLDACPNIEIRREVLFLLTVCLYAEFQFAEASRYMEMLLTVYPRHTTYELYWADRIQAQLEKHKDDAPAPPPRPAPIQSRYQQSGERGAYVSRRRQPFQIGAEVDGNVHQSIPGYEQEELDDDEPIL